MHEGGSACLDATTFTVNTFTCDYLKQFDEKISDDPGRENRPLRRLQLPLLLLLL